MYVPAQSPRRNVHEWSGPVYRLSAHSLRSRLDILLVHGAGRSGHHDHAWQHGQEGCEGQGAGYERHEGKSTSSIASLP